jgi:hypothetical protein
MREALWVGKEMEGSEWVGKEMEGSELNMACLRILGIAKKA